LRRLKLRLIGLDWRLFDGLIEGWFTQLYRRDHGELELATRRSIKDVKSAKHRRDQAKGYCDEPPVVLPRSARGTCVAVIHRWQNAVRHWCLFRWLENFACTANGATRLHGVIQPYCRRNGNIDAPKLVNVFPHCPIGIHFRCVQLRKKFKSKIIYIQTASASDRAGRVSLKSVYNSCQVIFWPTMKHQFCHAE
jgi:hypothetical protein